MKPLEYRGNHFPLCHFIYAEKGEGVVCLALATFIKCAVWQRVD